MRYDKRCLLIKKQWIDGMLGPVESEPIKQRVPCAVSGLSIEDQLSVFGSLRPSAFKLHLQGRHQLDQVEYEGVMRDPAVIKHLRNKTVVIVS